MDSSFIARPISYINDENTHQDIQLYIPSTLKNPLFRARIFCRMALYPRAWIRTLNGGFLNMEGIFGRGADKQLLQGVATPPGSE